MAKIKQILLRASEWARQEGLPREDFAYWDKTEGIISEERYKIIKQNIGR